MYAQGSPVEIQIPALEPDRLHDHPDACVIAQQYSSATFVSLRFHSRKEKFGALYENVTISIFKLFLNFVSPKMCNFKLRKTGSVCASFPCFGPIAHHTPTF
jgi:hypothetical protein